ncbi:MAG: hypothetical protein QXG78_02815 [Candidatus Methanomethyliaceae archaeon]
MNKKAQILLITLLVLLVLAVSTIIGISLMSSKITSLSRLIERGGDWFSSVISSLEYGLYKLNTINTPPQSEISVPYFGGENLIPFFKAPYTITIYGEQVLPIIYEGYFGFRDLIFPIQWIFKWIAKREAGVIKEVQINPSNIIDLEGKYYVANGNDTLYECLVVPIVYSTNLNFAYLENLNLLSFKNITYAAATPSPSLANCEAPLLHDGLLSPSVLIGDHPSTTSKLEDYFIIFSMPVPRYVDYGILYLNGGNLIGNTRISILYWSSSTSQFIEVASTTASNGIVNVPIGKTTGEIRISVVPNTTNAYALIPEVVFYGY